MPTMEVHTNQPQKPTLPSYEALWNKAISSSKPNLQELITFDWTQSEQTVNSFVDFLVNLVTYKSIYAYECYNLLIGSFEPYKISIKTGTKVAYEKWELIAMKVHFTFNKILSAIPLSSSILANLITDKFPHRSHPAEVQHFYFKNALFVTRYCPTISQTILSSAISSLIQIDVSISLDEMPDDEDLQFDIENENAAAAAFNSTSTSNLSQEAQEGKINAQKLDILMNLMLDYLDIRFGIAKKGSGNIFYFDNCEQQDLSTQDELFSNLIKIFDVTILPTYKSKYTQYLLFYVSKIYQRSSTFAPLNTNASLLTQAANTSNFLTPSFNKYPSSPKSPNTRFSTSQSPKKHKSFLHIDPVNIATGGKILYAESFIRFLFGKLCNEKVPVMYRHACAAYIGGFVSRASFLPNHIVKLVFRDLLNFAIAYVDKVDNKNNPNCFPDPQAHSLFYSVCQSVYYIFCFRNKIILDFSKDFANDKRDEKQREFWQDLHEAFRKISMSRLNPFKVCLKSVVRQFCSVCIRVGIFTKCTGILKNNKKIPLAKSTTNNSPTASGGSNQFDSFFPFDPYLLFHSSKFFANSYTHWKDIKKQGDEENLEELSDEEDEDSDDEDDLLDKLSSESDDEFSDFQGDSDDDDDSDSESESDSELSNDSDSEVDHLTEEFMSFTPEVRLGLEYHFKHRN
ncbi:hypothetical protein CYY_004832 [Polysphondylium violaceum]|uniref:RNA polymerase I-specific transcription initiation factor RRN3 n=1 Tax=Polysphondylium violaceum TaxID=133409 RepID=A0A8J4PVW1_9MYCE|nr:hypothetical protein CYY_004832 [Polysphondylium violaceum]